MNQEKPVKRSPFELLTEDQIVEEFGLTQARYLLTRHKLPNIQRAGKRLAVPRKDVEEFIANGGKHSRLK